MFFLNPDVSRGVLWILILLREGEFQKLASLQLELQRYLRI